MKITKKEREIEVIIEKHSDGYVAYPLGLKGIVVGQGDTYEKSLSDVESAIRFHIETFGEEVLRIMPGHDKAKEAVGRVERKIQKQK